MKVTRDVVTDLLLVYLAGEASADTSALVEEFASNDAEIRRLIDEQKKEAIGAKKPWKGTGVTPSPDLEVRTLARTKTMLTRRSWYLALAMMFTGLPFSFVFGSGRIAWMMVRDQPAMAGLCWAMALAFWMARFLMNRRLRITGL